MSKKGKSQRLEAKDPAPVLTPERRKLFRWVGLMLPLLLLFAAEWGLRIAGYGYPTGFFIPSKTGPPGSFVENPRFGWRFFPRRLARAPDPIRLSKIKPPGTCRIFVFGESAALGDPEQAYGFSRILQQLLSERCPGTRFEIVNVAMTAISSHVILRIARDCVPFQGDIWIFYTGNNEVVGPFGAGSVFGAKVPPRFLISAGLWIKGTRLGQLADALWQKASVHAVGAQRWEGMKMMLNEQIRAEDPVLQRVYNNFGRNLDEMLSVAHEAVIKSIVCSVSSNLRDCAPFASLNRKELSPSRKTEYDRLFASGAQMQAREQYTQALAQYQLAAEIDANGAELAFRMAQCHAALADAPAAWQYFLRARDLDALRFRADSAINGIIGVVSARHAADGIRFFDSDSVLTNACKLGIPGEECFWDHVHLNFDGNYRIARGLTAEVLSLLPPELRNGMPGNAQTLTESECAERLAYTDWDQRAVLEEMWRRVHDAPFTGQMDHDKLIERWSAWRAELDGKLNPDELARATHIYQSALARRPEDWRLHHRFGFLLETTGDWVGAQRQWEKVVELVPDYTDAWFKLADINARQSRPEQAVELYRRVLRLRPNSPEALNGLGLVRMSQGRREEAAAAFAQALQADPQFAQADVNWGLLLARRGQSAEAETHYRNALRSDPESGGALINLANLLAGEKRNPEAINLYQTAAKLQPEDANVRLALANALEANGRSPEAVEQYRESIRLNPRLVEAHFNCGVALAKRGDLDGAIGCFQNAAQLNPDDAQTRLALGVALAKLGRFGEAIAQFQAVLRLDPANEAAKRYLQMATARAGRAP